MTYHPIVINKKIIVGRLTLEKKNRIQTLAEFLPYTYYKFIDFGIYLATVNTNYIKNDEKLYIYTCYKSTFMFPQICCLSECFALLLFFVNKLI